MDDARPRELKFSRGDASVASVDTPDRCSGYATPAKALITTCPSRGPRELRGRIGVAV